MYSIFEDFIMKFYNVTPSPTGAEAEEIEQRRRFMAAVGVWELVICIVGAPVNALVFYLAVCISKKNGSGGKQQWFVASMTAADFLFASLHSPMFYALYTLGRPFYGFTCSFFYLVTHVSMVASSLNLLLLNVDKFLALYKPLHYPSLMTTARAGGLLTVCWLVSAGWAAFLVFGPFLTVNSNCGPEFKPQYRAMYYVFTIVFFAFPVCASVLISTFAIAVARRSRSSKLLITTSTCKGRACHVPHAESATTNGFGGGAVDGRRPHNERLKQVRAITFVFTTTVWSAVTLLPYRFAFILNLLGYSSVVLQFVFLTMTTMNALGNPFITMATQRQYRKQLKWLWRRLLCRHSLADNELLSRHVAATIRTLCQQQEQLLTAATRRAAKLNAVSSLGATQDALSPSSTEMTGSAGVPTMV